MILATKFHIPRPDPHGLVERPRLITAMDRIRPDMGPVLLVQAPAGFGKTTALTQWLQAASREGDATTAWVSLDPADNAPKVFWTGVFAALDRECPGAFAPLITLVEEGGPPNWPEILTTLVNRLHAQLNREGSPGTLTLVLDDLHRVHTPQVLEGLNFLLDHPLPGFTLVMASRTRPDMGLSRIRSLGRLVEITDHDLAFTPPEIQRLIQGFTPGQNPAPPQTLEHLAQRTEGWVTGIKLALISRSGNPLSTLSGLTGDGAHIRDYLLEEVYTGLPEPLKKLSARLSILDRFSPALCRALGGESTAIEEMQRRHLFLIPLDNAGEWFRFHHLFQDFLRRQLKAREAKSPIHAMAAACFESQDLFDEAFTHAVAAKDPMTAARLLSDQAPALYGRGGDESLLPYLSQLPRACVDAFIPLLCYDCTIRIYHGEFHVLDTMAARLDLEEKKNPIHPDTRLLDAFYQAGKGYHFFYGIGDMATTIQTCQAAQDRLPPGHDAMESMFRFLISLALRFIGEPVRARQFALESRGKTRLMSTMVAMNRASLEFEMGNLKMVKTILEQENREMVRDFGDTPPAIYGFLFIYKGVVAMAENRMETAATAFQRGMATIKNTTFIELIIIAQGEYALFLTEAGEFDKAHYIIDQAIATSARTGSWLQDYNLGIKQLVHLGQGRVAPVGLWAETHPLPRGKIPYHRTYDCLAHIRHALAPANPQPDPHRALALIETLIREDLAHSRNGRLLICLVLKARAHFLNRQFQEGETALAQALDLAAPQGYVRIFVTESQAPDWGNQVLTQARQLALPRDFVRSLEQALDHPDRQVAIHDIPETFNKREIDILTLFSQGRSNKEAASQLNLSVNTIRWYAARIFGKLYVNRRGQAVARARELGLVP